MDSILELFLLKLGYKKIYMKIWEKKWNEEQISLTVSLFNFDYLPDENGKNIDAIKKDGDKKIWKNEFDLLIFPFKVRSYDRIHENLRRKNLPTF